MDKEILKKQLIRHEGLRPYPYEDTVGKLTIGVGRNLSDRGISKEEALYLLNNDIELVIQDLNTFLPWWITLNEVRQLVLADMCFNLGINRLLKFKNTLNCIKAGNYTEAARNMLKSLWAKQTGNRAIRLAKMMKEG